jgi:hypothetical protein
MRVIDGMNVWDTPEELYLRQCGARQIGNRRWNKVSEAERKKWINRFINLAQSINSAKWVRVRRLKRQALEDVINAMMRDGFPADDPFDGGVKLPDANLGEVT